MLPPICLSILICFPGQQGETARDIATRKELTEILSILNNPVIPMPRNKEVNKENNKKKKVTQTLSSPMM